MESARHLPFIDEIYAAARAGTPPEECARRCMDAITEHPEDVDFCYGYASRFLVSTEDYDKHIAHCRHYLPLMREPACIKDVQHFLIDSLKAKGEREAAIEVRQQMLEQAARKDKASILEDIGDDYSEMGDVKTALDYYEQHLAYSDWEHVDYYYTLAEHYETLGDYAASARHYETAARQQAEDSVWLWVNTGRAIALQGGAENEERAMEYFRIALLIKPDTADAHYYMGVVYGNKGDVYRALHHYYEALKIKPDYPEALNNIGSIAYHEDSDIRGAIEKMEASLEMKPEGETLRLVYSNLSKLYKFIQDEEQHLYYKGKVFETMGLPAELAYFNTEEKEEDEDSGGDEDEI